MSWFVLNSQPSRRKRIGIWLKTESHTLADVHAAIKKSKLKRVDEAIERIVIREYHKDGRVFLEVWCKSLVDCVRKKNRHNVFLLLLKENEDWTCHGDLGRGLK